MEIIPGQFYKHFKGGIVLIDYIATHTETEERLVIYHHVNEYDEKIWARPIKMWNEQIPNREDGTMRFELLKELDSITLDNGKVIKGCCYVSSFNSPNNIIFVDKILQDSNGNSYVTFHPTTLPDDRYISEISKFVGVISDKHGNIGTKFYVSKNFK